MMATWPEWLLRLDALAVCVLMVERALALYRPAATRVEDRIELTRHLDLLRLAVWLSPLLGLLGTVAGMMLTFDALCRGALAAHSGEGLSSALRTTELGLAIAVPGILGERVLSRRAEILLRALPEQR